MNKCIPAGMVASNPAIYGSELAQARAADLLQAEHGIEHEPGTRADLCPLCIRLREQARQE